MSERECMGEGRAEGIAEGDACGLGFGGLGELNVGRGAGQKGFEGHPRMMALGFQHTSSRITIALLRKTTLASPTSCLCPWLRFFPPVSI